jgi:hypothetical protein
MDGCVDCGEVLDACLVSVIYSMPPFLAYIRVLALPPHLHGEILN